PAARRAGTGRALLELASADSRRRSRVPILDVDVRLHAAIALYEAVGLRRLGRVRIRLPTGDVAEELVYAPAP
ncbi:MAG: GNAT family N-acetyltransferase, partial [Acidimicrobiales bacterium]